MWDKVVSISDTAINQTINVLSDVYLRHPVISGSVVGALLVLTVLFIVEILNDDSQKAEPASPSKDVQAYRLRR